MELVTKFITLDNKESNYERVDMPETVVFYPYFHYKAAKSTELGNGNHVADKAYRIVVSLKEFSLPKLEEMEKAFSSGRPDDYGFWTVKNGEGSFIGMGANNLFLLVEKSICCDASYVLSRGTDILFLVKFGKDASGYTNCALEVYFSDANCDYAEKFGDVDLLLDGQHLKEPTTEFRPELVEYKFLKYSYYDDKARPNILPKNHSVSKAPGPMAFLDNVNGCAWHTVVYNDNVINDGPHYVLLKNCGIQYGNILDQLSSWLVHRRGGFVMGKEFASNDFTQETTFTIREVDEYEIGGITVLNIECDTYTKNRDEGLEAFLKSISESRFNHG